MVPYQKSTLLSRCVNTFYQTVSSQIIIILNAVAQTINLPLKFSMKRGSFIKSIHSVACRDYTGSLLDLCYFGLTPNAQFPSRLIVAQWIENSELRIVYMKDKRKFNIISVIRENGSRYIFVVVVALISCRGSLILAIGSINGSFFLRPVS